MSFVLYRDCATTALTCEDELALSLDTKSIVAGEAMAAARVLYASASLPYGQSLVRSPKTSKVGVMTSIPFLSPLVCIRFG
jgi:hypothetical protein